MITGEKEGIGCFNPPLAREERRTRSGQHILLNQFDHRPLAPAVFLTRELLDGVDELRFGLPRQNSGAGPEARASQAHVHLRMDAEILNPMRGLKFGDQVELAAAMCEPDFNLARQARLSPARSEIEIRLALKITAL